MSNHITVKNLPESERPYEKFFAFGAEHLSDAELLAIIIKTGTQKETSLEIARHLLEGNHNNLLNLYDRSFSEFLKIPGIGKVKAIQLKAVAELSKRIAKTYSGYQLQMNTPSSIAEYYMEQMRHRKEEVLVCAFFDAKCNFLGDALLSVGSVNYAYVSPRDIFCKALEHHAVLLILLHNHPSGDPTPSEDDIRITRRVAHGAALLELELADHIIIGDKQYYSFNEHQQIN
ncbi:MAG: DNA repair protein RadC [Lachnospiraceae bacterium]|nr:DNA repair protein RadC [Lachnospiraceae bacterium]